MSKRTLFLCGILLTACAVSLVGCNDSASIVTPTPNPEEQPVAAPQGVAASYTSTAASLSWEANSSALVVGYNVYRYAPGPERESAYLKINGGPVTTNHFTYDGMADGGYFRVRAVTSTGKEGASSQFYKVNAVSGDTGGEDHPPTEGEL